MNAPADISFLARTAKPITSYRKYWAARFGTAPFLPMSRAEMDRLGWDSCDIVLVTGDAYVDHPSFGMAVIGRTLEAQGFRVGILAQPDWHSADPFKALGKPNLFFGVTAGNMDSMINRYTADRKIRSDDAYTPGDVGGKRPDRAAIVYSQRCREAFKDAPIVLGGIEGSLRRIAHYDYWSDKVRRSMVVDSKCDILLYGNAERAIIEIAHRLAAREPVHEITDVRGTAFVQRSPREGWFEIDSTSVDAPGRVEDHVNPYHSTSEQAKGQGSTCAKEDANSLPPPAGEGGGGGRTTQPLVFVPNSNVSAKSPHPSPLPEGEGMKKRPPPRERTVIRLPSYEQVKSDPVLYAHASRVLHLETNPGNARALVQAHGDRDVWLNPPPIPLTTAEMDHVFGLPYARSPHPAYADENGGHDGATKIPAWEMIRFSVNIMRGCFGGCTFCSITEHEGRIIQSRSEPSILREIEHVRDKTKGFTGTISDLGGPTANMYRLACRSKEIETTCRRLSCVYPSICVNLGTDHSKLISLYRKARAIPGVKKILISSGLRYDLAVRSPEYVKELVTHHVGGLLKIAPEHTETNTLSKMMKPGIGAYDEFKEMFDRYSLEAGKKQYLIPYFIAAHPGTTDEDMLNLALWLKKNNFRLDQVQTFMPTPMAMATTMYHTRKNPLHKVTADSEVVETARSGKIRRIHKAFLRYQDPDNWAILREALIGMGRADLIGNGDKHLIPAWSPGEAGGKALVAEQRRAAPPPVAKAAPGPAGARGARANALTGSLTARTAIDTKARPSILDTIKVKKPAAAPAKGAKPARAAAPARGRK
ncbi:MAG TPA: YgiQ family radical SAM protein [Burkholderiaceae bacterium]|nr:YgiQ family radical SAM protein [Burkholderiaceae bacterium]